MQKKGGNLRSADKKGKEGKGSELRLPLRSKTSRREKIYH